MESPREPSERKAPRRRRLLDVLLATMQAMISIPAAIVANLAVFEATRESKARFGIAVLAFVFIVFATAEGVGYFRKRPTRISDLRNALVSAFCDALDRSSLNPGQRKVRSDS